MAKLKQDLCYTIRPMQDRDIPQAVEIDRAAFPIQWPHPSYTSFKQELCNRLAHYIVACQQIEFVLPIEETATNKTLWERLKHLLNPDQTPNGEILSPSREYILGIAGFWLMVGEAHITTIAVRDTCRRQGIGERLLISLIDMATQLNAQLVTLEVRPSNEQAQILYQKYGFYKAGVRHRYYTDNGEDAFIMNTDVITSPYFQSHFLELKKAYEQKWDFSVTEQNVTRSI
jgi:ribosomal-protein-alanine N-acetyltransferase